jgi:hypothetical protein
MIPVVIILTGIAHSGKDTSADYIVQKLQDKGFRATKVGLADCLKNVSQKLIELFYGVTIPIEEFYNLEKKEQVRPEFPNFNGQPFKLRTLLQFVGSEVFREMLWGSIWCDIVYQRYIKDNPYDYVVISDSRFPNELAYFKNLAESKEVGDLVSIKLLRNVHDELSKENQKHQSESHIDTMSTQYVIFNDGTKDQLYSQLQSIIDQF